MDQRTYDFKEVFSYFAYNEDSKNGKSSISNEVEGKEKIEKM